MTYLTRIVTDPVPQDEALDEKQVPNSAGGYSYPVDDFTRLGRFLILGSEGGSYYAGERQLTLENAAAVKRCVERDGERTVNEIMDVIRQGRAPKAGPPLFALAVATAHGSEDTRKLAFESVPDAARTASQLMQFVQYADALRGWGRGLRNVVANWYLEKIPEQVAYQAVKYRQRYGWTHRDLLRKSHADTPDINPDLREVFQWVTHGDLPGDRDALGIIHAYEQAKTADAKTLAALIRENRMSWEMVPAEMLQEKEVWQALYEDMPLVATVRNLATLTRVGVITPMRFDRAVETIGRIGRDDRSRIHPIQVLSALVTYRSGKAQRGDNTWTPVPQVTEALDAAFERSFQHAPQTGKWFYLAVDVSGSMSYGQIAGVPGLTPREAAAAMAMAIARREPNHYIAGFSRSDGSYRGAMMAPLDITAGDSLTDAMRKTEEMPFGGTDCALPMMDALDQKIPVDCFVVLTDSETWAGKIHPAEALRKYRREMDIPAKLVVVGMVSNGFTIADPEDAGMLDVVGFDAAAPRIIADFAGSDQIAVMEGEVE